jgi:GMP synthase (glutamine-hydrolysing)
LILKICIGILNKRRTFKTGYYDKLGKAFCVLLLVKTVGLIGNERSYEDVCVVRCVNRITIDWSNILNELLSKISSRIVDEVRGINKVVYDIT